MTGVPFELVSRPPKPCTPLAAQSLAEAGRSHDDLSAGYFAVSVGS
jgi:hypothetical protein